ncbi:cytochrome P450 [Streptomyces sp. MUM 203J]|uniref:cytochrome P450 n=1 Tax=Streptomyces sp. MUM 203J TaxID=2791990 RepID=UPI0023D903A6|nr:cytochrome P450 [Streptomyces sp. MUM 203J]MCH0539055.1 cytochrome P450 [Streptomyces sp. MUM 203J]
MSTTTPERTLLDFPFDARGDRLPPQVEDLRRERPVTRVRTIAGDEAWLVSSYELARLVLEDDRFSLKDTSVPGVPRQYALTIPPEVVNDMGNITGAGLRKAVLKALNPMAPGLVDWMRGHAARLVDRLVEPGPTADLRAEFTNPYSEGMHCRILGIPQRDAPFLARSLDIAFMNSACPIDGARVNWDRDIAHMTRRLDDPATTGLMAELAALRDDPDYAHLTDEMHATVGVTLFGAGVVSTAGFPDHGGLLALPAARGVGRAARAPERIPGAVEALLRVDLSIGDGLPRLALEDVTLGDTLVRKGELVLVLVEGANTDPAAFPEPDRFVVGRPNAAAHLSFGGGRHYCPATALGRRHAEIALRVLVERLPGLRLAVPADQLVWRTRYMKRLPEQLPVLW